MNKPNSFLSENWLLLFYLGAIVYLELCYKLWNYKSISPDFVFPVLFSFSAAGIFFILSGLLMPAANRIVAFLISFILVFCYTVQLIYFSIFRTPLSLYSLTGARDAMQFGGVITGTILNNIIGVLLLLMPLIFFLFIGRRRVFFRLKARPVLGALLFCAIAYAASVFCVRLTGDGATSQYTLYYKVFSPELSVNRLGLLTTMRLDLERLVLKKAIDDSKINNGSKTDKELTPDKSEASSEQTAADKVAVGYNKMNIDFRALAAKEKDPLLLGMHKYFSTVIPAKKNKYTGIFKGYNLILITAEGFSPYVVSPELTPTLYKMSTQGFVFRNFYNPVWGVSTSDGEYVACTGLIPKAGIWSFARSGKNYMPFAMGNQFRNLGYMTKAYHDHTYNYYKRDISHPNLGYDYKGVGNGLNIRKTWPESDLEMIEVTAGDYIGPKSFHTYYMTVSGHLLYTFSGNYIASKNKGLVDHLNYSDSVKAYIACNLEFEFAMKALLDKLEAEGIAERTVIAISPDHYPYGLTKDCIDEIAGHKVESNFELYKSIWILWKKGMEPVVVDKACSSLDIIPTLSNLFGLQYDSRLLMGDDALSVDPPLVIFGNRSWISGRASYNAADNTVKFIDGTKEDSGYIREINRIVAQKFEFSAKILDTDYYRKVVQGGVLNPAK